MPDGPQITASMARGLDVLRAFGSDEEWLGNQELALRTGLPKPTVTRATNTLLEAGFLESAPGQLKFRLGPAILVLAGRVTRLAALRAMLRPMLQALAAELGVSLGAAHIDQTDMVYFEYCRSSAAVSLSLGEGSRASVLRSAAGSAFLAASHAAEREQLWANAAGQGAGLPPALEEQRRAAEAELAADGYCRAFGTWHPEVNTIAVPYRVPVSGLLIAVTAAGPNFNLPAARLEAEVAPRLLAAMTHLRGSFAP